MVLKDNKEQSRRIQSGGKISQHKEASTFSSPEFGMTSKCHSVFIRTFGCQMNNRDSELIYGLLNREGYEKAACLEDADIIIFNTCAVRKHAEDRVWGQVGMLKKFVAPP